MVTIASASHADGYDALGLVLESSQDKQASLQRASSSQHRGASSSRTSKGQGEHLLDGAGSRGHWAVDPSSPLSNKAPLQSRPSMPGTDQVSRSSPILPTRLDTSSQAIERRAIRRATHDAAGPSRMPLPRAARSTATEHMLDVPLTTSPDVSRSPSLKRARDHRFSDSPNVTQSASPWLSPSPTEASDAILEISTESQTAQYRHLQRSTSLTSSWSHRARRWSSSLHQGRDSTAFALRLAEGASPYLKAGLEELRSIFDVDSMPVPASPFEDDESDIDDAERAYWASSTQASSRAASISPTTLRSKESSGARASPLPDDSFAHSIPLSASPQNVTPPAICNQDGQTDAHNGPQQHNRQGALVGVEATLPWKTKRYSAITPVRERGAFLRPHPAPNAKRHFVAASLAVIAIGVTSICAWGYATQADIFSSTLVGFFLAQPAFALMGLGSILLRRRPLMDLCSRAMRAHVLAQAVVVVLAYLDLSASSVYTVGQGGVSRSPDKKSIRMMPSMEMRFGPLHAPTEAGAAVHHAAHAADASPSDTSCSSLVRAANRAVAKGALVSSSLHAHDTRVGDWRSRLTHLVVFLVQGAIPIILVLVGQYVVAQRLAGLARRGNLSRQSSVRSNASASSSSLSACQFKVDSSKATECGKALHAPSGALALRRASKGTDQLDLCAVAAGVGASPKQPDIPTTYVPVRELRRPGNDRRCKRRPNTSDGTCNEYIPRGRLPETQGVEGETGGSDVPKE